MLSTRHSPKNKGHIQTEIEGLEKVIPCTHEAAQLGDKQVMLIPPAVDQLLTIRARNLGQISLCAL